MTNKCTRRDFLKVSAAATAGLVAAPYVSTGNSQPADRGEAFEYAAGLVKEARPYLDRLMGEYLRRAPSDVFILPGAFQPIDVEGFRVNLKGGRGSEILTL